MGLWHLNLRQLRAAIAVSEVGSVSGASKIVHVSQPAITQGLAKLEWQLGVTLFERSASGMKVTKAGSLFIKRARHALDRIASPRVTMTQMKALIALARAGSYARAARDTQLSQPSLHRAIGDLSVALGEELVRRRGRGVALTDKGRSLARAFRLAKSELEAGLTELSALLGQETGCIAVGAMPLSRARIIPEVVSAFCANNPDARVNIMEGAFHELIEPLRDGEIDLMVGALRDPGLDPEISQRLLFHDRPAIVGRQGHPALASDASLTTLSQFAWVLPPLQTPLRQQCEAMFADAGIHLPHVPVECGSAITIRQILLQSDFLTVLSPEQLELELKAEVLEVIASTPTSLKRSIGLSTRIDWRPTPLQAAFIELLIDSAGSSELV